MMLRKALILFTCLLAGLLTQAASAGQPPTIKDAWIADAPATTTIRAAYLQLHNTGSHTIIVKDFSSPDFARIELHKTIVEGGMMKMEEVKHLSIKPGERFEFKPGAYHLMLFTPRRKLHEGDKVTMQVRLEDDTTAGFTAVVRKRGDAAPDHEHHHH